MDTDRAPRQIARRPGGRSARVRAAILTAAIDELTEYGYAGMSAARIAERANVNRTTVHRRWPNLEDLIAEALIEGATAAVPIPDTGSVQGDLRQLLREITGLIDTPEARGRIRALVADAARSPAIGAVVSKVWTTRFHRGEKVIERGVARGELRDDVPPATILATLTGPLYVRLLITDERIDNDFIEAVLELSLQGAQTNEARTREPAREGRQDQKDIRSA